MHDLKSKTQIRRILISGGLAVGGPQTHIAILCRVLRQSGAEVSIAAASTNWPPQAITELRAMGVRVVVSPFGFGKWKLLGKLFAFVFWPLLLRRDHEVLYCVGEGRMHLLAKRFVRGGALTIYHEIVECPLPNSVAAQVARKMRMMVANSKRVGEEMARLFPSIPVRVLPFFTSRNLMPLPRHQIVARDSSLRIAFLGRLVSHKQPGRLIESWPSWTAHTPVGPARLDLYGGDYDNTTKDLEARIVAMKLESQVKLHGAYSHADLPRIFAQTDLVILPSLYEGLPLVLVEAMQHGVPVVATSAGGTEELGQNNPDVIITNGTDWEAFAGGLVLMCQKLRRGEINSARLRRWTESRYGFDEVAKAWREVLLTSNSVVRV